MNRIVSNFQLSVNTFYKVLCKNIPTNFDNGEILSQNTFSWQCGAFVLYCTIIIFILLAMKEKSTRCGCISEPGVVWARCKRRRKGTLEPDTQRGHGENRVNQGGTAGIVSLVPVEQTEAGVFYLPWRFGDTETDREGCSLNDNQGVKLQWTFRKWF